MTVESTLPPPAGAETPAPSPPGADLPPSDAAAVDRRRKRRRVVLLLLLMSAIALLLFGAWYLINRKPVSELPLPGITEADVPHYAYSIYDVIAPTGVAVNPDGSRIYATQTEGERMVIAFDASGNQVATLTPPETGTGDHVPVYVAVDPTNGDVYVSDRPAATVYVYAADGTYLREFDPGAAFKSWAPLGLTFDRRGHLFVTNVGAPFQAVHEFTTDGALVRTFGKPEQFDFPNGVAVDANGNVYVSDSNNGRLVAFAPDGTELGMIRRGVAAGDLGLPRGAAVDDKGRIYVADISQQGIQSYQAIETGERAPTYIAGFGVEGSDDGAFRLPNAVAVDGRARVYIADWRNNRIQVWTY